MTVSEIINIIHEQCIENEVFELLTQWMIEDRYNKMVKIGENEATIRAINKIATRNGTGGQRMQIVINIPEDCYREIASRDMLEESRCNYVDIWRKTIAKGISNGVVLPSEHGSLIDRSKLEPDCDWDDYYDYYQGYSTGQIEDAEAVVPATKGE